MCVLADLLTREPIERGLDVPYGAAGFGLCHASSSTQADGATREQPRSSHIVSVVRPSRYLVAHGVEPRVLDHHERVHAVRLIELAHLHAPPGQHSPRRMEPYPCFNLAPIQPSHASLPWSG